MYLSEFVDWMVDTLRDGRIVVRMEIGEVGSSSPMQVKIWAWSLTSAEFVGAGNQKVGQVFFYRMNGKYLPLEVEVSDAHSWQDACFQYVKDMPGNYMEPEEVRCVITAPQWRNIAIWHSAATQELDRLLGALLMIPKDDRPYSQGAFCELLAERLEACIAGAKKEGRRQTVLV